MRLRDQIKIETRRYVRRVDAKIIEIVGAGIKHNRWDRSNVVRERRARRVPRLSECERRQGQTGKLIFTVID